MMMDDTLIPPVITTDPTVMSSSSPVCPKCNRGTMRRTNFRTGSMDKPKADVMVCAKCGHRVELKSD